MSRDKKQSTNKNFKKLEIRNKKRIPIMYLTNGQPQKKKVVYKSDLKLSKAERSEKEFEKVNFILQTKHESFFNATFKNRGRTLPSKLLKLEKEKKKSYWRLKLTSRYCAWRYLQQFRKPKNDQEQVEQKKIKSGDSVFWFIPQKELEKEAVSTQLTDLYPKTRDQKIKEILNTYSIKNQIYYQPRQSTIVFLLEKEKTNSMLNTNKKTRAAKVIKTVKKRKKRFKRLIKKRKTIKVFELKKTKIKQLRKKKKLKTIQNLYNKTLINFVSNLKVKNKWLKIQKILAVNMPAYKK